MNTCFYSDVLWLHLGYRISTLECEENEILKKPKQFAMKTIHF